MAHLLFNVLLQMREKVPPNPPSSVLTRLPESMVWLSKTMDIHLHRIFGVSLPFGSVRFLPKKYRQTETGVKKKKRTKAKTGNESSPTAYNAASANIRK